MNIISCYRKNSISRSNARAIFLVCTYRVTYQIYEVHKYHGRHQLVVRFSTHMSWFREKKPVSVSRTLSVGGCYYYSHVTVGSHINMNTIIFDTRRSTTKKIQEA
jgi:hypothetical protein